MVYRLGSRLLFIQEMHHVLFWHYDRTAAFQLAALSIQQDSWRAKLQSSFLEAGEGERAVKLDPKYCSDLWNGPHCIQNPKSGISILLSTLYFTASGGARKFCREPHLSVPVPLPCLFGAILLPPPRMVLKRRWSGCFHTTVRIPAKLRLQS